jgi:hypothetical protein
MSKIVHGFTTEHGYVTEQQIMALTDEQWNSIKTLPYIDYLRNKVQKLKEILSNTETMQLKDERAMIRISYRQKAINKTISDLREAEK